MYSRVSGQFFQTIPVQKTKDKCMRHKTARVTVNASVS